jgi:hypothetical protein
MVALPTSEESEAGGDGGRRRGSDDGDEEDEDNGKPGFVSRLNLDADEGGVIASGGDDGDSDDVDGLKKDASGRGRFVQQNYQPLAVNE